MFAELFLIVFVLFVLLLSVELAELIAEIRSASIATATAVVNALTPLIGIIMCSLELLCLLLLYEIILGKKKHRESASGSATGVDTPVAAGEGGMVEVGGGRQLPLVQFEDARRYFELFQEALSAKYRHREYSLMYNKITGMCSVLGRANSVFQFNYEPAVIKNHYCTFRLGGDDMGKYLSEAQSHYGVQNHTERGLITPPSCGEASVAYRK